MQRRIGFPQHKTPALKLLMLTQSVVAVVNAHPALKAIEGGWQVLVPGFSLAISLVMGLAFTDYDSLRQTVSQMVHYPHGWLLTIDFVALAAWLLFLSVKIYYIFARRTATRISGLILLFTAIGFVFIAIFPTNLEGTSRNLAAEIHEFAARAVSVLFPAACLMLLPQLWHDRNHRYLAVYTAITAATGLVFVGICAVVIFGGGTTLGLFERILMANALVWGLVAGSRLFPVYRR